MKVDWKSLAKRWRQLFKTENLGSRRLHDRLVEEMELRRVEADWLKRADGNRIEDRNYLCR